MFKNQHARITGTTVTISLKTTVIILATTALFLQDLTIIFNDALHSETTSHLLAIPLLFAYLIYRKRNMLRAVVPIENKHEPKETRYLPIITGTLLLTIAVLLYWYGSHTFTPLEYHMLTLPIFVAGLTLIIFNPQTLRQLAFPICFLIFLIPPPSEILYALGGTLSVVSSEASNAIVNAFGIPSTITSEYGNPTIIVTRPDNTAIPFTVDIACSGIYSLIGFLIFAVFIAYIIRDKPWKKLALILIGLPLIYSLNIARITIILILGYHYGEALALQAFHLLGGWILIFLGTLLLLTISEKIFKTKIFTSSAQKCSRCSQPKTKQDFCPYCGRILKPLSMKISKVDIVKIAAIATSVIVLMSIQTPVFALTEASPIVVIDTPSGQQVSTTILPQVPDYTLTFWYRDTDFEEKAKQDMSLAYFYSPTNQSKEPTWVAIEIASTRSSLHRWETCLITWPLSKGYQPKVTQIELRDIQLTENPPIIGRYFAFQYVATNETQAVLYWYETAIFTVNSTSQQKHVKISVITYPETIEDVPNIKNQMITIATAIANYWQPIKTWSQITMIISQNGANLAAVTSIMLIATLIFNHIENRKQKKTSTNVYQKISTQHKQIVDAVREIEKTVKPTLDDLAKTMGKSISKKQLLQELSELEKIGIIKSIISSQQDEPIKTWKTQIIIK